MSQDYVCCTVPMHESRSEPCPSHKGAAVCHDRGGTATTSHVVGGASKCHPARTGTSGCLFLCRASFPLLPFALVSHIFALVSSVMALSRRLQVASAVVSKSLYHPLIAGLDVCILSSSAGSPTSQQWRAASSSFKPPAAPFPIFTNIKDYRKWRRGVQRSAILSSSSHASSSSSSSVEAEASPAELAAEAQAGSVGFVPTMGALHAGHLDLVRRSLRDNRHTVVSIFVNPAQFAPTEDLASYPRTLESDIAALVQLEKEVKGSSSVSTAQGNGGKISAIFCPDVREMYPPLPGTQTPFTQNVSQQQGAFIEVQGLSSVLEGKSRPGFFRGVATVVTKLWHVVEVS